MENNDDFEKLISFHINNEIKKHSSKGVIFQEELMQIVIKDSGLSEEKIREFFEGFNKAIRKLHNEDPEGLKRFFKEKFGADFNFYDS
ncbi:MAG: hypothetical protein WC679_07540 [Bacteroidales bacterium]|jgi:hypothetical protein